MWRAEAAGEALPLHHAVALGLLQGPTELLPVSSSAHTALLPYLAGWRYAELDGSSRKSFEVALHAGAGLALALVMRERLERCSRPRGAGVIALASVPPALAGLALGASIERRAGGPRSIAAGLALGGLAMALADAAPARARRCEEATALDGLALGAAQALALIPGVSRSGAALTAARARGFTRPAARSLSWAAALPVLAGASLLKGLALVRDGVQPPMRRALAAGALSAFCSTLGSSALLRAGGERPLLPYSLYRCALALAVLARAARGG